MLSKNKIKFINSIKKKKYRDIHQYFFVEGEKLVDELLHSDVQIISVLAVKDWIEKKQSKLSNLTDIEIIEVTEEELKKISALTTPNKILVIAKQPSHSFEINEIKEKLNIFLDNIKDPGNLGTIIRIADWYGIKNIFCSSESVDVFNPKVVQSTMGAIFRTEIHYVDSSNFLKKLQQLNNFNIYGTFLKGDNIYKTELSKNGIIIMGSESHGISDKIKPFINKQLFIPNYPLDAKTSESLNISIATAIACSEFRRRIM